MTNEEMYRAICMKLLLAEYAYRILCHPILEDTIFDRIQLIISKVEEKYPHLKHPKAPRVGYSASEDPNDYPKSVRSFWMSREPDELDSEFLESYINSFYELESMILDSEEKEDSFQNLFA